MLFGLFSGASFLDVLIGMLYRIPGILIGLTIHECAHAYAAYKLGDPPAKNLGRLSLDPLKHMDLFGTLMLVIAGFGWARPVLVNTRNFKKPRRDDTIVSLAGVTANLLFAFVLTGVLFALITGPLNEIVYQLILTTIVINLSLAIFNLIPIPPLDGYHVFKNAFIRLGSNFFMMFERYGQFLLLAIIITGVANSTIGFLISSILKLFLGFYSLFI